MTINDEHESKKFGEILISAGLITENQLDSALTKQKRTGKRLGDILVELGFVTENDVAHAYSVQLGIPYKNLASVEISPDVLKIISEDLAERYIIIPLGADEESIIIATSDPSCGAITDSIAFATGKKVKIAISTPTEIRKAIQQFYHGSKPEKLGELLITAGLINKDQLESALRQKEKTKKRIGEILVEAGYISEGDMAQAISLHLGVPYTDLSSATVEQKAVETVPEGLAIKHLLLPLSIDEHSITVVMANPLDIKAINAINFATSKNVMVTVSSATEIKKAIQKYYCDVKPERLGSIVVDAPLVSSKKYAQGLEKAKKRIGEILKDAGLITEEQLLMCLEIQKESNKRLGKILVEYGYVKETDIIHSIGTYMGIPYAADLTSLNPDSKAIQAVPVGFAERHLVLPLSLDKDAVTVVIANPLDKRTINEIASTTGKKEVKVSIAPPMEIRKAIQWVYRQYSPKKLGEILIESGLITEEQLSTSLGIQKESKKKLGEILVDRGYVKEEDIARAFADQMGIDYIDLSSAEPDPKVFKAVRPEVANRYSLVPLSIDRGIITVAMADPLDLDAINDIKRITGKNVKVLVSTSTAIKNMIVKCSQFTDPLMEMVGKVEVIDTQKVEVFQTADDAIKRTESQPVIRLVNNMITQAVKSKSSDIHLEPRQSAVVVRNRVDGLLRIVNYLPKWAQWPVVSRIKIMAKLDISERRIPQDGRIKVKLDNKEVDLRVNTLPTHHGEKVVIRLLDPTSAILNLKDMGLSREDYEKLISTIEKPQGIVLVTGPTGSGKSSTMYAMIRHIKDIAKNIVTLEDPIEYELDGVNQVNISERLSFAQALRSVLRQDPDVVLIGEMRDEETANIAVQASVTGHLVISTLHTNTAVAAISRLRNLGVKPFMIASSLNGIVAQRLVRKVCGLCKKKYLPIEDDFIRLGFKGIEDMEGFEAFRGDGCPACNKTGYKGRSGVFEILTVNSKIRDMIVNEMSEDQIVQAAREEGMKHMVEDGLEKVRQGIISIFDLSRVITAEKGVDKTGAIVCRSCGELLRNDFHSCPFCGYLLSNNCVCGKPLEPEWKYCPYCSKVLY